MKWTVDPNHSQVTFSARHMGIFTVRGSFGKFEIDLDYNAKNPAASSVVARIDAASIDTGNEQRDGHLASPDFLDAETYPELVFESTRIEKLSGRTGKIHGDLTIRGVTRPATLDVEFTDEVRSPWGTTSMGFNARTVIDRTDWGLNWNQVLEAGGLLVSNEITIHIELEAVRQTEVEDAREAALSAN